jgi:hypothetical protein
MPQITNTRTHAQIVECDRRLATQLGRCYQRVQAFIVTIEQNAEAATRNREYFLNKLHSIGGRRKGDIP